MPVTEALSFLDPINRLPGFRAGWIGRVEGIEPEAVRIGMAVQARIATQDDKPLVVFDPVDNKEAA